MNPNVVSSGRKAQREVDNFQRFRELSRQLLDIESAEKKTAEAIQQEVGQEVAARRSGLALLWQTGALGRPPPQERIITAIAAAPAARLATKSWTLDIRRARMTAAAGEQAEISRRTEIPGAETASPGEAGLRLHQTSCENAAAFGQALLHFQPLRLRSELCKQSSKLDSSLRTRSLAVAALTTKGLAFLGQSRDRKGAGSARLNLQPAVNQATQTRTARCPSPDGGCRARSGPGRRVDCRRPAPMSPRDTAGHPPGT